MFKLSKSKGQWFLISAVVASGIFLVISFLFRGFFSVDTSEIAMLNEDLFLSSVKDGFDKTVEQSNCTNLERNLDEFVYFNKKSLAEKGYIFDIKYSLENCIVTTDLILVSSDSMETWIGERPEIDSVIATRVNNKITQITTNLKSSFSYNISGNLSIYDNTGFVDSYIFTISKNTNSISTALNNLSVDSGAHARISGHLFAGEKLFFI